MGWQLAQLQKLAGEAPRDFRIHGHGPCSVTRRRRCLAAESGEECLELPAGVGNFFLEPVSALVSLAVLPQRAKRLQSIPVGARSQETAQPLPFARSIDGVVRRVDVDADLALKGLRERSIGKIEYVAAAHLEQRLHELEVCPANLGRQPLCSFGSRHVRADSPQAATTLIRAEGRDLGFFLMTISTS